MSQNRIETVPALSAVRAIPAALAPWRYQRLPEWQRDFRTADADHHIQQYFHALATGDRQRADLLEGVPVAKGAPLDGTVGQLVPLPLDAYVFPALYRFSKMMQLAKLFTATSSTHRVPLQNAVSVSDWVDEGEAPTSTEPTVSRFQTFVLQKHVTLSTVSNELLEDAFGLVDWLTSDVLRQMAQEEDFTFYNFGSNNVLGQPEGFERSVTTTIDQPDQFYVPTDPTQTTLPDFRLPTVIDYAHVQKMFFALPEQARSAAVWTGNDLVEEALSNMLDSTGRPLFPIQDVPVRTISDGVANTPTRSVFGRPYVNMPGQLDTSGTPGQDDNRLYFVDMRRSYGIASMDLRIDRSSLGNVFASDSTQFRFVHRVDGKSFEDKSGATLYNTGDFSRSAYVYTGSIIGQGDLTP